MVPLNMFTDIFVIHGLKNINDPGHILVCRF